MASTRRLAPAAPGGLLACLVLAAAPAVAQWSITPRNVLSLSTGSVPDVSELSGVTYLGPAGGGLQRFAAVQDDGNQVVLLDVRSAADASLLSAQAVSAVSLLASNLDYEGIAYTGPARSTVFISEEESPGVHEFDLATGSLLQSVSIPSVFSNVRDNRGFESLARSADGATMWTANEQALMVDGPESSDTHGTTVRLLRLDDNGSGVTTGPQFAYQVDPVHGPGTKNSGVADLVMLPDDTLLALERSKANDTVPAVQNRIYQIDFTGATDVSVAPYASGLDGRTFTPVGKTLLWSGAVGSADGANMEGLALGPQLASGNWLLLGVVDNGGSGSNPIAAFELSYSGGNLPGDYDGNGSVGEEDYLLWRATFGQTGDLAADGNGNGTVDAADYTVWRDHLGDTSPFGAAAASAGATAENVPEPGAAALLVGCLLAGGAVVNRRAGHHAVVAAEDSRRQNVAG
jgi:hypothetical protein